MNDLEKTTLQAAVSVAKQKVAHNGQPHCEAHEVYAAVQSQGQFKLEEIAIALLQLRDDGMVETDAPTFGDPGDGQFSIHLTPDGIQTAESLAK